MAASFSSVSCRRPTTLTSAQRQRNHCHQRQSAPHTRRKRLQGRAGASSTRPRLALPPFLPRGALGGPPTAGILNREQRQVKDGLTQPTAINMCDRTATSPSCRIKDDETPNFPPPPGLLIETRPTFHSSVGQFRGCTREIRCASRSLSPRGLGT